MKRTLAQKLLYNYQQRPSETAIYLLSSNAEEQKVSKRNLFEGSAAYAHRFMQAGLEPGEICILILPHGEDLVFAFWGAILAGVIPSIMPFLTEKLSPDRYRQSLRSLFSITRPAGVVTYPAFVEEVESAANQKESSIRSILVTGEEETKTIPEPSNMPGLGCDEDEIALLQHSSGTTGLQKGVALTHGAIFNQVESYARSLQMDKDDVIVSWLPLYHDMGLIAGFILPIVQGLPLVLMSPFDWVRAPYRLLHAITRYRGTLCWQPNFAYNFCAQKVRQPDLDKVDLSSLRAMINCSEPMSWKSHQLFMERFRPYGLRQSALATSYAMAENVFAVTQGGIAQPVVVDRIDREQFSSQHIALPTHQQTNSIRVLSAGKPLENTQLRIQDEDGRILPERYIGEIAIKSNCMLKEYYNRPEATAQAFMDGWYLTGDLGYIADGELFITGRKKDLIIVGGKNIYPQDIENLVNEIPGIHSGRVVAFGVYNERTGTEDVVAVAEAENNNPADHQALANTIRRYVTKNSDIALRLVQLVARDWLIKTSSGKIARAANKQKYLEEFHHV